MEWQLALLILIVIFFAIMITGIPMAIAFMVVNIIGILLFWGGTTGLGQLGPSILQSVAAFTLLPLVLFILMGETMFRSGIAPDMLHAVDMWLGRVPGRLSLIAVVAGTILGALTGLEFATVAILGKGLMPEMEKRGYKKSMAMGPILGSGNLAILIPPSDLAIIMGAIGRMSVGRLLMAIISPALVMAALFGGYIIVTSTLNPSIAPPYKVPPVPMRERILTSVKHILPISIVVFLVVGVIILGVATPTEAAATGALGMFFLAAIHKKLTRKVFVDSLTGTLETSVMILFIIAGAAAFAQILAFTGATGGLVEFFLGLPISPMLVIVGSQIMILVLGMLMDPISIMMIALPLFMPIVKALGFDPVWFGVLGLINLAIGSISPPFGLSLFVMKGLSPPGVTIIDIFKASMPWVILSLVTMGLVMAFPQIALWLPEVMSG